MEHTGYTVHIGGADLSLKWVGSDDPSQENIELLKRVKEHKGEVLDYLRLLQTPQAKLTKPLLIESGYLKDSFYLVANDTQAMEIERKGKVCYLPGEIQALLANSSRMDEEALKDYLNKVHMVKRMFPGSMTVPRLGG